MLTDIRARWPEKGKFVIDRPVGLKEYTFLHFITEMQIIINGERITAKPGACIFYAPDQPQYFCSDKDIVHDWFHADARLSALLQKYNIKENTLLYPQNSEVITACIYKLEREFFGNRPYRQCKIEAVLNDFLITLSRLLLEQGQNTVSNTDIALMRNIRDAVFSAIALDWTVESMAQLAGISESRFHSKYKSVFGVSPINDLIIARINFAKNKLLHSDKKISEIAFEVGYKNEYHFIRQFHKIVGVSPGSFRKHNKV